MKTRVLFIAVLIPALCLLSGCRSNTKSSAAETGEVTETQGHDISEPEPDSRGKGPLGVRSAIIEYTYSGDKTGKSTHYIDDYGNKTAMYTETSGDGELNRGWVVSSGDFQYMWDPSNPGGGMKMKNPLLSLAAQGDLLSQTEKIYEQMGMKKSGTEMFRGKECLVYKGPMGKVLIWNGILMMMELNLGSVVSRQEATSIQSNVRVDSKYFRIPENITFSEIPGF
jgi:hypothetical protein